VDIAISTDNNIFGLYFKICFSGLSLSFKHSLKLDLICKNQPLLPFLLSPSPPLCGGEVSPLLLSSPSTAWRGGFSHPIILPLHCVEGED